MAAGHNSFRGSGPNRKPALEGAMTHTGSPDPSIDLVCLTSFALTNSFGRSVRWRSSCRQHQNRLVVSLLSTRLSYATSMPQCRRRPQHHKRTNHRRPKPTVVSCCPKADIDRRHLNVRFVPTTDSCGPDSVTLRLA